MDNITLSLAKSYAKKINSNGSFKEYSSGKGILINNDTIEIDETVVSLGENLYSYSRSCNGYLDTSGNPYSNNSPQKERTSEYIAVSEGNNYVFQSWVTIPEGEGQWMAVCYYDSSFAMVGSRSTKTSVDTVTDGVSNTIWKLTVPSGVAYMRISGRTWGNALFKLEKGTEATKYTDARADVINNIDFPTGELATWIPSSNFNGTIEFNTSTRTVTIPPDMIIAYRWNGVQHKEILPKKITLSFAATTSLHKIIYNVYTKTYNSVSHLYNNHTFELTVAWVRFINKTTYCGITMPYYVDGYLYGISNLPSNDYDCLVKGINHRGYNTVAPENTLSAFKLSKKYGFKYVECDVSFTSDGVPVLLHDNTIDRTSNGTGNISEMTFEEVRTYDFGSWKSDVYTGEQIPSFEEFIILCKKLGLHPYIEMKHPTTAENVQTMFDILKKYRMQNNVTWISFLNYCLGYVKDINPSARLGLLCGEVLETTISLATNLMNDSNEVFIDVQSSVLTDDMVQLCIDADIPLEVWTINASHGVNTMNPYISGVTSDSLIAGKELLNRNV